MKTIKRSKCQTNKPAQHFPRMAFFVSLILLNTLFLSSPAYSSEPEHLEIHGAIITDFLRNRNSDDTFSHYATDSGSNFTSTVNESWFSLSGGFEKINGMETTFEASFDFMGENDFEIVSAWIRLEKGKWYFLAGKAENLVATGETTLNYDGFYSAGGIQTGAKANQNQLQWGIQLKKHLKLAMSLTDEPAQNGSMDGEIFSTERPGVEAALFFHFDWGNGKIATHNADMRFYSGSHFHPSIIMAQWNFPITETLSWLVSGFRTRAGSQFFTIDLLFDCTHLPDGKIHEFTSAGGLTQLIFASGNIESWMGIGSFSLTEYSESYLWEHRPDDALTHNHRLSMGTRYDFSDHLHIGIEFTWYKSTHLTKSGTLTFYGKSIQFQTSLTF